MERVAASINAPGLQNCTQAFGRNPAGHQMWRHAERHVTPDKNMKNILYRCLGRPMREAATASD